MALAPISQDVRQFSEKLGLSTDLSLIDRAWNLEIGSMREYARVVAIDRASLIVEVDSHSVMHEITLRRRELIRKMNNHLPAPTLQFMTVRISHGR